MEEPWDVRRADTATRHAADQVAGSGAGPLKAPTGWAIGSNARITTTAAGRLRVAMAVVPLAVAAVTTTKHWKIFSGRYS